jgi:DNA replication and repair protein RecF
LFVPEDLALVKGPAERRRSLIDNIGQQLSATYHKISEDYQRVLRQRNRLLKKQWEASYTGNPINSAHILVQESWDESIIVIGAQLFTHRLRLYKRLSEKAARYYGELSKKEELTSAYVPSFDPAHTDKVKALPLTPLTSLPTTREEAEEALRLQFKELREEEWARGISLVGPHRDEIRFVLDGRDARAFGSQGQQRSIALACKLAELELIREISGNDPLLLLDDVASELDTARRAALLTLLDEDICAVITTTDTDSLGKDLFTRAQVVNLRGA